MKLGAKGVKFGKCLCSESAIVGRGLAPASDFVLRDKIALPSGKNLRCRSSFGRCEFRFWRNSRREQAPALHWQTKNKIGCNILHGGVCIFKQKTSARLSGGYEIRYSPVPRRTPFLSKARITRALMRKVLTTTNSSSTMTLIRAESSMASQAISR